MSEKEISLSSTISVDDAEIYTIRFSPDSSLLAAGCDDGSIKVYQPKSGKLMYELKTPESVLGSLPVTAIRFRPASEISGSKNVLIAASADGSVSHWHVTSGRCMHRIWTDYEKPDPKQRKSIGDIGSFRQRMEETSFREAKEEYPSEGFKKLQTTRYDYSERRDRRAQSTTHERTHISTFFSDNQVFCVDYRNDGSLFASAGKDKIVRVYDEATKNLVHEMDTGTGRITPGHSNRVFSLKFNPADPNLLVSGGWDNTVQIWDLRVDRAVRSIFGPHICGDSVDVIDDIIMTGSWRPEDQLQLWDLGSGELIETIPWHQSAVHTSSPSMLYCAEFSKGEGRYIAAGGSGTNDAKVFDRHHGNCLVGTILGSTKAIFSLDFDHLNHKIAVAGGDSAIRVLNIHTKTGVNVKSLKSKNSSGLLAEYKTSDPEPRYTEHKESKS